VAELIKLTDDNDAAQIPTIALQNEDLAV